MPSTKPTYSMAGSFRAGSLAASFTCSPPLDLFNANVQQTHGGRVRPKRQRRHGFAHDGKLNNWEASAPMVAPTSRTMLSPRMLAISPRWRGGRSRQGFQHKARQAMRAPYCRGHGSLGFASCARHLRLPHAALATATTDGLARLLGHAHGYVGVADLGPALQFGMALIEGPGCPDPQ